MTIGDGYIYLLVRVSMQVLHPPRHLVLGYALMYKKGKGRLPIQQYPVAQRAHMSPFTSHRTFRLRLSRSRRSIHIMYTCMESIHP